MHPAIEAAFVKMGAGFKQLADSGQDDDWVRLQDYLTAAWQNREISPREADQLIGDMEELSRQGKVQLGTPDLRAIRDGYERTSGRWLRRALGLGMGVITQ